MILAPRTLARIAFVALVAACGTSRGTSLPPIGQLLLYLDTDAPLPAAPGDLVGPDDIPSLFDRVRIEVIAPGADAPCVDCTHEFDVDRRLVGEGRASVGITIRPGAGGYLARVRLFRAADVELGEPRADAALDSTVALPPTPAEGVVAITVVLHTDDVARRLGVPSPLSPELGPARPGLVGSWPSARRLPCAGHARPGEVCVPGGAYWMGNPALRGLHVPGDDVVMRLVAVSPFFIDATEVVVRAFRPSGFQEPRDPMLHMLHDGEPGPVLHCTFTAQPGNFEALPVNCISWDKARAYCQARGADLPSEAQFQYVAGGLQSARYPWGDSAPGCEDAVFARAPGVVSEELKCAGAWVEPPGSSRLDHVLLPGGGVVVDLAGNLAEHVRDRWNLQSESCWGTGVARDPVCDTPSVDATRAGARTVVAGSFVELGGLLAVASRRPGPSFAVASAAGDAGGLFAPVIANTGFRCARADAP